MGSAAGLSLPCISVASGHMRGTQLLPVGFSMDQEPGDAAGEVSPSLHHGHGCGQASSGACRHGAASSLHTGPRAPSLCVGRARGAREPSRAPSRSRYLLPPSAPRREPGQPLHKAAIPAPAPAQGGGSGLSPLAGCPHCTVTTGISQQSREPALGSMRSAPGRFPATAGEGHVPHGVLGVASGNTDGVSCALQSVTGHENNKDSRLLWMGSSDCLISVGFSQVRSSPGRWPRRYRDVQPRSLWRLCQGPKVLFGWPVPHESRRSPLQVT